jgi:low temperature requirement protein LtrA
MPPSTLTNEQGSAVRVSTLELFFDLVFVFTITQVSDLILHAHNLQEIARAFLVLTIIWWMYGGYAWLTNNVGTANRSIACSCLRQWPASW